MAIEIASGFTQSERAALAALYWDAFRAKLGRVMGPDARAQAYLIRAMRPDHALVARDAGRVVGVAGFKTQVGAFLGGDIPAMRAAYGPIGGAWRMRALALLQRDVDNHRFLIDGICVAPDARSRGIGARLLHALGDEARMRGYPALRLDVSDTNPRAKNLYLREGFEPVAVDHIGPLRLIFGFASATTMVRAV